MRSLSSMIAEVRSQTAEVQSVVDRLRGASRMLTGATGEAPTNIANAKGAAPVPEPERPLLHQLDVELERLNSATADLRDEMNHVESYSETAMVTEKAAYNNAALGATTTGQYRA